MQLQLQWNCWSALLQLQCNLCSVFLQLQLHCNCCSSLPCNSTAAMLCWGCSFIVTVALQCCRYNVTIAVHCCSCSFITTIAVCLCWYNATVAVCLCSYRFFVTVAFHCCWCNASIPVHLCSRSLVETAAVHCNSYKKLLQSISPAAASSELLQYLAAVATQPLQCFPAAVSSLQFIAVDAT